MILQYSSFQTLKNEFSFITPIYPALLLSNFKIFLKFVLITPKRCMHLDIKKHRKATNWII
jgi:hypothetical protein